MSKKLKSFYVLTKPGIIYGNLLTTAGGFLFGANLRPDFLLLCITLLGTALVIACGCVVNNYIDRDIDKHMKRTKKRALVSGEISGPAALIYASLLGISGLLILSFGTNALTVLLGTIALISYALVYTFAKRVTVHGTLIGTVPGAIPPVAGYTAAVNQLDVSAWLLFTIMVFWQMAHFYAIAIYRLRDYKAARIPVMPAVHGIFTTKLQILLYACGFTVCITLLGWLSYAGLIFLAVMIPLSIWWLIIIFGGLFATDDVAWAKKIFGISLLVLTAFSFCLSVNAWMP